MQYVIKTGTRVALRSCCGFELRHSAFRTCCQPQLTVSTMDRNTGIACCALFPHIWQEFKLSVRVAGPHFVPYSTLSQQVTGRVCPKENRRGLGIQKQAIYEGAPRTGVAGDQRPMRKRRRLNYPLVMHRCDPPPGNTDLGSSLHVCAGRKMPPNSAYLFFCLS